VPGVPTTVPVPGDKPLYVIHAPAENRRVLIYLHGWCGKIESVESWKETATAHGTLIALLGDLKCPNGRAKWSKKTELHHERIQRAIAAVKEVRGGALDPDDLMLIGYSQGAARAYRLAQRHSSTYDRLVLGGPPEPPSTEFLGRARAIAVLGGELETTEYMRNGTASLQEAGKLARYFMLPKSRHGQYGPEAERVMTEVFDWLERVAPN
jgi:pimeloyl-ACP methyl ester carboxylesterase